MRFVVQGVAMFLSVAALTGCGTADTKEPATSVTAQEAAEEVSTVQESVQEDETTGFSTAQMDADLSTVLASVALPVGDFTTKELDPVNVVSEEEVSRIDRAMRAYTPSSESLLVNNYEDFYYYSQLDADTQNLYDAIMMVCEDPVSEDNYSVYVSEDAADSDEFNFKLYSAYLAITFDHPELFWLYNSTETSLGYSSSNIEVGGKYQIYLGLTEPYEKYEEQMTAFNQATEDFLKDIDTTASDEEVATQIHDKLTDLVTYDMPVCDKGMEEYENLAHTAYGALVADSDGNKNYAVCDGYSLAYEYLCQQVGIDCIFIGGKAGSTEAEAGGHAWNLVKVGGKWGEVDTTWDDNKESFDEIIDQLSPSTNGYDIIMEALKDQDYRDRLEHYLYNISTDRIRNYTPTDEDYYITKDGKHGICLMFDSVHIRDSEDMPEHPMGAIISLAPNAN